MQQLLTGNKRFKAFGDPTKDGELPENWSIQKLKDLSKQKISNGVFNDPKKVGRGYKLINVKNLYTLNSINPDQLKLIDLSHNDFTKFKASKGDLFFTRSSLKVDGIAHCNILDTDAYDIVYECHIMRMKPDAARIISKYLQEYCLSQKARKYSVRSINNTKKILIATPPHRKTPRQSQQR